MARLARVFTARAARPRRAGSVWRGYSPVPVYIASIRWRPKTQPLNASEYWHTCVDTDEYPRQTDSLQN